MSRGSALLALLVLLAAAAVCVVRRDAVRRRVREYFAATASPLSLAVFRVTLFAVVLTYTLLAWPGVLSYTRLPRSALVPPRGLGPVLAVTPLSPGFARAVGVVLVVAAACGLLGLYARTAAAVTVVAGTYFLGIPGFYGKVDHVAHLLWLAALLAASPCADVLSVDAVRRAWRRADTGDVGPPPPSRAYGLPLRLAWLLVACLYLFPGLWKYRSAGIEWAVSDNLRNVMFGKWAELGVLPAFAAFVEQNTRLTQLAAAAAVVFELGFVVALFLRRWRVLAVVAGFGFHVVNRYVLYIDFWTLYWLYVVFVPWDAFLGRVGRAAFRRPMVALYDGGCGICRRTVATLLTVDVLRRVDWVAAQDADVDIPRDELLRDLHVVEGERVTRGFEAYRRIARRYPLLWPALPFAYLPPVAAIGRRVYRRVADTRACAVAPLPEPAGPTRTPVRQRAVVAVFGAVALPAVLLGVAGVEQAWPVSAYPAFRGVRPATLDLVGARVGPDERPLDLRLLLGYTPQAWTAISQAVAGADPAGRAARARALHGIAVASEPALRGQRVVLVLDTVSTLPSERGRPPLRSAVLLVVPPGA